MACLHPTLRGLLVSLRPHGRFLRPPGGLTANRGIRSAGWRGCTAGQGIWPPCATGDLLTCSRRQLLAQQQPKFRGSSFPRGSGARAAVPRR